MIGSGGFFFLNTSPELIHCVHKPFIIMKLFIIPIIQQTLQEQFTYFLCGGRMFPVYLYRRREQDGIGLLDSA